MFMGTNFVIEKHLLLGYELQMPFCHFKVTVISFVEFELAVAEIIIEEQYQTAENLLNINFEFQ